MNEDSIIQSYFTPEYVAAVDELRRENWQVISKRAEKAGVVKTQGSKWEDFADEVVSAEFEQAEKDIYVEGYSPEKIAEQQSSGGRTHYDEEPSGPLYPTEHYKDLGIRVRKDGDKPKTDLNGRLIPDV